jgi:hypothetical protein
VPAGSRSIGRKRAISAVSSTGTIRAHRRSLRRGRPCCCEPPAPTGLSSSCRSLKLTLRLRLACPLSNWQQCHGCVSERGPRAGQVGVVPLGACGLRAGVRRLPVTHRPGGRGRRPLVRRCARGGLGRRSWVAWVAWVGACPFSRLGSGQPRLSRRSPIFAAWSSRDDMSQRVWALPAGPIHEGVEGGEGCETCGIHQPESSDETDDSCADPQSAASTRDGLAESAVQPFRAHFGLAVLLASSS